MPMTRNWKYTKFGSPKISGNTRHWKWKYLKFGRHVDPGVVLCGVMRVGTDGEGRVSPHLPLPTYPLSKTMKWISLKYSKLSSSIAIAFKSQSSFADKIRNKLEKKTEGGLGVSQYCNATHFSMFWTLRRTQFKCEAENLSCVPLTPHNNWWQERGTPTQQLRLWEPASNSPYSPLPF